MSNPITATKEEIQKAFDLWYDEYGTTPEDFDDDSTSEASDTFLAYLGQVQENE